MIIDDTLLNKLEKLAMIQIPNNKREAFKEELTEIVAKMDTLQEVDTHHIAIQNHQTTPMREDTIQYANIRDHLLSHAPKSQDGYFIVPKILD